MTDTYERCSCGTRAKCSKENGLDSGKMCLKEDGKAFNELTEKLWKEHPKEMAEAQAWVKDFLAECVPIPVELIERMDVIKKKAEENREKGLDNEI